MQAIQGTYSYGKLRLKNKAPKENSSVIVIFTDESAPAADEFDTSEALRIFHKHAGSIKGSVDEKKERLTYLDERYGNLN